MLEIPKGGKGIGTNSETPSQTVYRTLMDTDFQRRRDKLVAFAHTEGILSLLGQGTLEGHRQHTILKREHRDVLGPRWSCR